MRIWQANHNIVDRKLEFVFINEKPKRSLVDEISAIQANDGITHYYYLKDNPERIVKIFEESERFIICTHDNKAIAFISIRLIPHLINSQRYAAQIRFIEVDKNYQGRGIAKKLVRLALASAFFSGAEYVFSLVESESDKESFLKKIGCKYFYNDPYYYKTASSFKSASALLFPVNDKENRGTQKLGVPVIIAKSETVHYYQNDNRIIVTKFDNIHDLKSFGSERLYLHQECANSKEIANYKIETEGCGVLYEFLSEII